MKKVVFDFLLENKGKVFRWKDFSKYVLLKGYSPWMVQYWIPILERDGLITKITRGYYKVNTEEVEKKYKEILEVLNFG